ncbi:nucleotide-diphospho-sugar transferases superfamily protein [Actinidia rufa]|uniref:Glycosyltransferases n=1 Tax=Actinidia rufa TaxID=165716 RepID=A0A7J0GCB5_9ERIC|nr:nucleotide-diphospho-sugar transferases superfamily protein [Actinidia rufa]
MVPGFYDNKQTSVMVWAFMHFHNIHSHSRAPSYELYFQVPNSLQTSFKYHFWRFGTWTVAKLMDSNRRAHMQGPICNGTQVIGWHSNEVTRKFRRFHAEMSGFAFNSTILWDPKRWHRPTLEPLRQLDTPNGGFQASSFIEQVVEDESQMECLPQDHSRIMVWHLHVESSYSYPPEWVMKNNLDVIASLA